ncbi:unnamed protein product [Moneuplotes crassus]|uniref:Uncharacterized protein n=1 Tax=Euplotes crassus TaxID=5936 RepID=A0AAD1UNV8_EUPCR|nr:unnamed protein product [Moneuplotes crassus]
MNGNKILQVDSSKINIISNQNSMSREIKLPLKLSEEGTLQYPALCKPDTSQLELIRKQYQPQINYTDLTHLPSPDYNKEVDSLLASIDKYSSIPSIRWDSLGLEELYISISKDKVTKAQAHSSVSSSDSLKSSTITNSFLQAHNLFSTSFDISKQ